MDITKLKLQMQKFGWTQKALSEEVGLSIRQVERILGGHCPVSKPVEKLIRAAIPMD